MPPDRNHAEGLNGLLVAVVREGDTLIEVGCTQRLLAIEAVTLGAQGALVVERDALRLSAGAAVVEHAHLKDTIRLARGDFATWPLIPAKHVICHVGGGNLPPLFARLRLAARSGAVLLTRLRAELVSTVVERMPDMAVEAQMPVEEPSRVALLLYPRVHAAPAYEPAWRDTPTAS